MEPVIDQEVRIAKVGIFTVLTTAFADLLLAMFIGLRECGETRSATADDLCHWPISRSTAAGTIALVVEWLPLAVVILGTALAYRRAAFRHLAFSVAIAVTVAALYVVASLAVLG